MNKVERDIANLPDTTASVKEKFGFESRMVVPAYSEADPHVPDIDPDYLFDEQTTLAILSGFAFNRRVMVSGYHGTGKSTHIEQVAARLNWPCGSIWTAMSAVSTSSARTPSWSRTGCR